MSVHSLALPEKVSSPRCVTSVSAILLDTACACETLDADPASVSVQANVYDLWVLRDTDGNMFGQRGAHSNYTAERLAAGLPFPVTTCWNGMVVLPAKPFMQGLRFRCASLASKSKHVPVPHRYCAKKLGSWAPTSNWPNCPPQAC